MTEWDPDPDGAERDPFLLDGEGDDEIHFDVFGSYVSNPPLYRKWRDCFRQHQPPVLIAWGKYDQIFPTAGAEPDERDQYTQLYVEIARRVRCRIASRSPGLYNPPDVG